MMLRRLQHPNNSLRSPSLSLFCLLSTQSITQSTPPHPLSTDVLIVGGGPTGLLLSSLLSLFNVSNILIESSPTPPSHPQAHFLNTRTMEILHSHFSGLHGKVVEASPPKKEWRKFKFGYSALNGTQLGSYDHFVSAACQNLTLSSPVECTHLAQGEFARLLLNQARDTAAEVKTSNGAFDSEIFFGTKLTSFKFNQTTNEIEATTSQNTPIHAKFLCACDGSHSFARSSLNIPMNGTRSIQHLMNIHFSAPSISHLFLDSGKEAMLYFSYNDSVIAVFVAHDISKGEWVAQVPFFPPFQEPSDFPVALCKDLVIKGLGLDDNYAKDINVISARPWTMSSQVAETYGSEDGRVLLVGDAAHVFPPAGGFGMNTGLQDAHNLAYKLSHACKTNTTTKEVIKQYENERKPVASTYASLSQRNFTRTLDIAKILGLNADHPKLLIAVMTGPLFKFMSMDNKRATFKTLLDAAMLPLQVLKNGASSNVIGSTFKSRVQKLLDSGKGLPLLFPKYELGFSYGSDGVVREGEDTDDYVPLVKPGHRLPHCALSGELTTLDLSPQVMRYLGENEACFIVVGKTGETLWNDEVVNMIKAETGHNVKLVLITKHGDISDISKKDSGADLVLSDVNGVWEKLVNSCDIPFYNVEQKVAVVTRPDGMCYKVIRK